VKNVASDLREREEAIICELWGKIPVKMLAEILGLHRSTVTKRVKSLGLSISEPKQPKHIQLVPQLKELLDGLLLGGNALSLKRKSAFFVATSKEPEYISWIAKQLKECGIELEGRGIYQKHCSYVLITRSYYEFRSLYERWYSQGKKEVPPDLKLTPKILLLWFIRGGHIEVAQKKPQRAIRFWVGRYSPCSREHLIKELQEIGFKPALYVGRRISMIRIGPRDFSYFFDYIGPCPQDLEKTFGHKWALALSR